MLSITVSTLFVSIVIVWGMACIERRHRWLIYGFAGYAITEFIAYPIWIWLSLPHPTTWIESLLISAALTVVIHQVAERGLAWYVKRLHLQQ